MFNAPGNPLRPGLTSGIESGLEGMMQRGNTLPRRRVPPWPHLMEPRKPLIQGFLDLESTEGKGQIQRRDSVHQSLLWSRSVAPGIFPLNLMAQTGKPGTTLHRRPI